MLRYALALALVFPTVPCAAQTDAPGSEPGTEEGLSLIERGAMILLRSMMDRIGPELDRMGEEMGLAVEEMKPALEELARLIGDIRNYEPPEVLPNGDIIIRRKRPELPPMPGSETEIEL